MITAIVRFKLPANVTLDAATELFKGSAPKYQNLPGLIRNWRQVRSFYDPQRPDWVPALPIF